MWKKTAGRDGQIYDSASEAKIANWLFQRRINYDGHKALPPPSIGFCDFYLIDYDLWVEYDGLMEVRRDDKLIRKKKFYEQHGLKYVVITRKDWQRELHEAMMLA